MASWLRGFRHLFVPGGFLLFAACAGNEPDDPVLVRAHEWQAQESVAEQAAREQQAREDAHALELQQAVQALESDPPATPSEDQFYQELEYYCGACHFPTESPAPEAYFDYFNDLQLLISRDKVIPGDAESSPLIAHMRADQTPPEAWDTPSVTDIAIQLVANFINQLPADSDESASGR